MKLQLPTLDRGGDILLDPHVRHRFVRAAAFLASLACEAGDPGDQLAWLLVVLEMLASRPHLEIEA